MRGGEEEDDNKFYVSDCWNIRLACKLHYIQLADLYKQPIFAS